MSSVKESVKETIQKLGVDCNLGVAKRHFIKNYKRELCDSTFYEVRKRLRLEVAPVAPVAPKHSIVTKKDSVVELVRTAKRLIDALDKNDAMDLIDSL